MYILCTSSKINVLLCYYVSLDGILMCAPDLRKTFDLFSMMHLNLTDMVVRHNWLHGKLDYQKIIKQWTEIDMDFDSEKVREVRLRMVTSLRLRMVTSLWWSRHCWIKIPLGFLTVKLEGAPMHFLFNAISF